MINNTNPQTETRDLKVREDEEAKNFVQDNSIASWNAWWLQFLEEKIPT